MKEISYAQIFQFTVFFSQHLKIIFVFVTTEIIPAIFIMTSDK